MSRWTDGRMDGWMDEQLARKMGELAITCRFL